VELLGNFKIGQELLIINGLITFIGLWLISKPGIKKYRPLRMDLIHPKANEYVDQYSNATPPVLKAMYEAIMAEHPHAHLQSNWNQGGFLAFLAKCYNPNTLLKLVLLMALALYVWQKD